MILRLVMGRVPATLDVPELLRLRARVARTLRGMRGLESVIVGAHGTNALAASVWRDPESMLRVTGSVADDDRFVREQLEMDLGVDQVSLFQVIGRTFMAMPPEDAAYVRALTVQAPIHDEARLIGVLRERQARIMDLGVVASHLGSRMLPNGRAEALHLSVWPADHPSLVAMDPMRSPDLADWRDDLRLATFDGVEIAPRLPDAVGPPLIVLDDGLRIVDLTASGAAALGLPPEELVGRRLDEVRFLGDGARRSPWPVMLERGLVSGETEWAVPDIGVVRLHILGRRDAPVQGRHTVMVRRIHEQALIETDLDAALALEFSN